MPQAILLQDSRRSASAARVVDVSKGYLRNYLIPRKLAAAGDQGRRSRPRPSARGRGRARRSPRRTAAAQETAELLSRPCSRSRTRRATTAACSAPSPSQDIVDAIQEARGIAIDRRKVHLEEPISTVGTRMVEVEVEDGVTATVKTMVVEQK